MEDTINAVEMYDKCAMRTIKVSDGKGHFVETVVGIPFKSPIPTKGITPERFAQAMVARYPDQKYELVMAMVRGFDLWLNNRACNKAAPKPNGKASDGLINVVLAELANDPAKAKSAGPDILGYARKEAQRRLVERPIDVTKTLDSHDGYIRNVAFGDRFNLIYGKKLDQ